jgi:predicted site-specific integrase-resolvase
MMLPKMGFEIVVVNRDAESENDLMKDLVSVITSFCCRLYGNRKGVSKSKEIKELINK